MRGRARRVTGWDPPPAAGLLVVPARATLTAVTAATPVDGAVAPVPACPRARLQQQPHLNGAVAPCACVCPRSWTRV